MSEALRFGPMSRRLLTAMALAAVIPTLAAVTGSYFFFRNALLSELARRQREVAWRASERLSTELDATFLRLASESHDLPRLDEEELFYVAVQLGRDLPELDAVFWMGEDGAERFRWERTRVTTPDDRMDWGDTTLFAATRGGFDFLGPVALSPNQEPTVTVALPLRGARREISGAIGAVVNLKTMWERTYELEPGSEGAVYVVDKRGKLIGHPNPSLVLRGVDASNVETVAALRGKSQQHVARGLTGERVQFAGAPVRRTGWLVLVETPLDVALRGHRESLLGTLLVLGLVLGGTGLYIQLGADRIAEPLRRLTERSRCLAGEASASESAQPPDGDEVEVLTSAFDRMQTALSEKERRLRWNAERLESLHEMERGILRGVSVSELAGLAAAAFARIGIDVAVAVSERSPAEASLVSASKGELAEVAESIALTGGGGERSGETGGVSFLAFPMVSESSEIGRAVFVSGGSELFAPKVVDVARQLADTLTIAIAKARLGERLERERAYISQIIDAAPTIICTLSPDGYVHSVNRALNKVTGLGTSEVVGRHASSLEALGFDADFTPPPAGCVKQWEARVANGEDGERVLSWTASSRPGSEGGIEEVIVIGSDVTEQRLLETRLRLAQKMEAVGQLAGGIAHDFNNLLTVIVGYSTLLLGDERLDEKSRTRIEQVARAGDRAASLVQQLLAFSRRQVMHPQTLQLNSVLVELKPFLSRLLEENIRLVFALAPDLWMTRFDPVQLEQVVLNLAVNSRDAMREGGSLTFRTWNLVLARPAQRGQVVVPEGDYVKFTVSDTGEGIDADKLERIFEPFFTTKEPGKGTGLGLSTVYGIMKQSGGYIFASSEKGRGTRFELLIPRAAPVEEKAGESLEECVERGGETVLVVEDDERVLRLVVSILEGLGYRVLTARNGRDAIGVAKRFEGPIDVLVTDAVMPRLNGPDLARELQKSRPELRVLVTSGYLDREKAGLGPEAAFLEKPFTPDRLGRKVREVLERGAR